MWQVCGVVVRSQAILLITILILSHKALVSYSEIKKMSNVVRWEGWSKLQSSEKSKMSVDINFE